MLSERRNIKKRAVNLFVDIDLLDEARRTAHQHFRDA